MCHNVLQRARLFHGLQKAAEGLAQPVMGAVGAMSAMGAMGAIGLKDPKGLKPKALLEFDDISRLLMLRDWACPTNNTF